MCDSAERYRVLLSRSGLLILATLVSCLFIAAGLLSSAAAVQSANGDIQSFASYGIDSQIESHGGPFDLRPSADVSGKIPEEPGSFLIAGCPMTVLPNNNSTSGNMRAPSIRYRYGRSVYLITASEMAAAGFTAGSSPIAIGWSYQTGPGLVGTGSLIVYMENTADVTNNKSTTWSTAISTMTVVHNAATTLPSGAGPFDITLAGAPPFTYTGGSLYVAFDFQYPTGTLSTTAVVWCNNTLLGGLKGAQSATAPPTTIAASDFRPETRLTPAVAIINNDASVDYVIAMGSLPLGLTGLQTFQAVVTNRGANPLTNLPVSLDITGIESFFDVQIVPALAACGGQAVVTFAPFSPTLLGSDLVTVSVPPDDLPGNSTRSRPMDVDLPLYSYKHPGTTAGGGVGFTGSTGALLAKFSVTAPTSITAAVLEFPATSATTYRLAIYGDAGGGVPDLVPLYLDAVDRTVTSTGPVTIPLPSPLPVGVGSFFVGIHQTNTTNAGLSFDAENPIRAASFYGASPLPPTSWFDFAPGNNFKLNIGVVLDRCSMVVAASNNGPICDGGTLELYCSAPGGGTFSWTGPSGFTSTLQNPTIPGATSTNSGQYDVLVNGCVSASTIATVNGPYTIVASAGPHGIIDPSGAISVHCGADQSFAIIPDPDAEIQDVLVDGVSQGPIAVYVFTDVDSDHSIEALFAVLPTPPPDPMATIAGDEPDGSYVSFGVGMIPSLPTDFFGPGSDPFDGQVCLEGNPLDGGSSGDASVLIRRQSNPIDRMAPPGSTGTVPIEIVALSLVSCQPITVTYNGGQTPERWNVNVSLSVVPAPPGMLHATKTHANGGTFDSQFYVQPLFVFTKVCDPAQVMLDTGLMGMPPLQFMGPDGYWVHDVNPALGILAPSDGAFVPGVAEIIPGDPLSQEIHRFHAQETSGAARHTVIPAEPFPAPPPDPLATVSGVEPDGSHIFFGMGAIPPIPPGFFDPGSDPFDGEVCLNGVPFGGFGDGSTLVQRGSDPFDRGDLPGSTATIPIEIVALNLVSCQPITVTYNGGQAPELWDVHVGLSVIPAPVGSFYATKTHCNGGTYSSTFFVQPLFRFTKVGSGSIRELDTGLFMMPPLQFMAPDGYWVHDVNPALQVIAPSDGHFVPGVYEAVPGDPTSQVLHRLHAQEPSGAARHTVLPARRTSQSVPTSILNGFWVRAYPNPFNPGTRIDYASPEQGPLSIKIYNLRGELVRTLIDGVVRGGADFVLWDGTDGRGARAASGVYFCEIVSRGRTAHAKLTLLR